MKKIEGKDTRYYIDLDIKTLKVLGWDYGHRDVLIKEKPINPNHRRIFITRGQYNKLAGSKPKTPNIKHQSLTPRL